MTVPRYTWQPTTAEIAAAAGIRVQDVIRFDHNTSPFSTEWAPAVVLGPANHLNEYPGADYRPIREAAAAYTEVDVDQVAVGAGVDELILLIARAFLGPDRRAVSVTPTYPLYRIAAAQVGARTNEIPASGPAFALPVDALVSAARNADLVWVCVPNNPTGERPGDGDIEAIVAATDGIVVIDAAYAEFAGDTWGAWVRRHHNVLVLHTLSKGFGLAGARVGFGLGHPDLVNAIDGVRPPGSIASLSVEVAVAALANLPRMQRRVETIVASRASLEARLTALGFRVLPSATNFLLCEAGPDAKRIARDLMAEGLVVRTFPDDGPLREHIRFTIRTEPEHDRLLDALGRSLA